MNKLFYLLPSLLAFSLYAQDANAQSKGSGYMQTIVMLVIALVFFYFILLRPEQKRRKQAQKMRESMKEGDKVTAMGLLGTIDKVTDNTVILKTYDGAKIVVLKAAITDVQSQTSKVEKS